MSKDRIDEIKAALVSYLATSAQAAAQGWQVRRLSSNDLGKDQSILVTPPAVLVFYAGPGRQKALDPTGTRYDLWVPFQLFIISTYKATEEQQEDQADKMIEDLRTLCAGRQLVLGNGNITHLWLTPGRAEGGFPEWRGFTPELATVYEMPVWVHAHWDNA